MKSWLRGKPVLAFGAAQFRTLVGVFPVASVHEVKSVLDQISRGYIAPNDQEFSGQLSWVFENSYPKDARLNGSIAAFRAALTPDPLTAATAFASAGPIDG